MSKYRERRQKIQQRISKSVDDLWYLRQQAEGGEEGIYIDLNEDLVEQILSLIIAAFY